METGFGNREGNENSKKGSILNISLIHLLTHYTEGGRWRVEKFIRYHRIIQEIALGAFLEQYHDHDTGLMLFLCVLHLYIPS